MQNFQSTSKGLNEIIIKKQEDDDLIKRSQKKYNTPKEKDVMSFRAQAILEELKISEHLEKLRSTRREKLKQTFDLNLGMENSKKDAIILENVTRGSENISALTMMSGEDTAGLVRVLNKKDKKL